MATPISLLTTSGFWNIIFGPAVPGAVATLSLARAPDAGRYGTVLVDADGRFVAGFREKEAASGAMGRWLNAGAYVIEKDLLAKLQPNIVSSLERDVLPHSRGRRQSGGVPLHGVVLRHRHPPGFDSVY